jgi:hypothetical protein
MTFPSMMERVAYVKNCELASRTPLITYQKGQQVIANSSLFFGYPVGVKRMADQPAT